MAAILAFPPSQYLVAACTGKAARASSTDSTAGAAMRLPTGDADRKGRMTGSLSGGAGTWEAEDFIGRAGKKRKEAAWGLEEAPARRDSLAGPAADLGERTGRKFVF